ncbi:hypothetical protein [Roseburia sp.]|uniref:hypothetical protein n=1 Tax=Roseburia sp. TaxID=2049040 RepID=UPI0035224D05
MGEAQENECVSLFFLQKTVLLGRYTQFISFENVTKSAPKITVSKIAKKELKHP